MPFLRSLAHLLSELGRTLRAERITVQFPFAPAELPDHFRGRVTIVEEGSCKGCGLCARDCPALALELERRELGNVRVVCEDAVQFIGRCLPERSLDRVLLFFPDPWHKKRHHKRRIVQHAFVELLATRLKTGGILHMATDWENYAEHMLEVLSASEHFRNRAGAGNYSPRPDYRTETKFERRGLRLGHGVWDLVFERI